MRIIYTPIHSYVQAFKNADEGTNRVIIELNFILLNPTILFLIEPYGSALTLNYLILNLFIFILKIKILSNFFLY